MIRLSIVTPCLPAKSAHLAECAESVGRIRRDAPSLDIQWIIVVDGPGSFGAPLGADTVLSLPHQRGVAAARNYGLGLATGDYLIALDADDRLCADGVVAGCELLDARPELGWVAGNRLLITGERTAHWHERREWDAGAVAAEWSAPMAFHANTLVTRTPLVRRLGGWPGLGACEDLLLALRLGEISAGASMRNVLVEYRAWAGQTTRDPTFRTEQLHAYTFIEGSVNELRHARGRPPVAHPEPLGGLGSLPHDGS